MKHNKEPWYLTDYGALASGEELAPKYILGITEDNRKANAARIVQCVNACAGIADPETALGQFKMLITLIKTHDIKNFNLDCLGQELSELFEEDQ